MSFLLLGALAASVASAATAGAGEADDVITIGNRCAAYGPGVVELDNGMCARVNNTNSGYVRINPAVRIEPAARTTITGWSAGATSRAALRSDGNGMVPGAGEANHLRVGAGLDSYAR